jgi:Asp-tRNA(Asn)/Glu-tRNA(Gln) amidotransferase A subunit family amidase
MSKALLTRKDFLTSVIAVTAATVLPVHASSQEKLADDITVADLKAAQKLIGLSFTDEELEKALPDVKDSLKGFLQLRQLPIGYAVEPPTVFMPKSHRHIFERPGISVKTTPVSVKRPKNDQDLAYLSVRELGHLVRTRQVSSTELTELSLKRLEQYGDKLLCVVTLMADEARAAAKRADTEIASGHYRGPLHGIPCGLKDLFATKGTPTTWGAEPFKNQVFDYDAAVVEKLHAAGAVVCAKLSMGALALGDVWFRGMTKNPWNPKEGSSGSSAGVASAVSACLLPFGIGTETLGSIISPSTRCRVTGFRPTFGRVSRFGAMALSWTMDKIGPICREVEDCALVFAAIAGADPRDRSTIDRPFHYTPSADWSRLKIGYVKVGQPANASNKTDDEDFLKVLRSLGAKVRTLKITPPTPQILSVLEVEGATVFDELTRTGHINDLKGSPWGETFRYNRFVPGVEYLQAQRARAMLMDSFEDELGDCDMFVVSQIGGATLRITNLTGHPQVVVPFGTDAAGASRSVSFVGRLYEEPTMLAVAHAFQQATDFHKRHPDLSKLG